MQMKVILDTNFLLLPATLKVDIFSQLREIDPSVELFIVDKAIDELERIKKEQKKFRTAVELALQLIKCQNIKVIKTEKVKNVDDIILKKSEEGYAVATQDRELKRRLREKGRKIIIMRQKKYIRLE